MKLFQARLSIASLLISLLSLTGSANAATPTATHKELTRTVDNSIQWAQHLRNEVSKGENMNRTHTKQEMSSLQESLNEMSQAYLNLSTQPAAEVSEAHFVAIKQHQTKAEAALRKVETEFGRTNPDYGAMKKAAKEIEMELKGAAKEHKAELNEIDIK